MSAVLLMDVSQVPTVLAFADHQDPLNNFFFFPYATSVLCFALCPTALLVELYFFPYPFSLVILCVFVFVSSTRL